MIFLPEGALNSMMTCPQCNQGDMVKEMCPNDVAICIHDIVDGIAYCEKCGEPMCPICKSHDVSCVSRITGYLSDVAGWNAGKAQELKDRHRVDINGN